jgi:ribonuclease HI
MIGLLNDVFLSDAEIYCDGASSGNPGHSGMGVIIRFKERPYVVPARQDRFREDYRFSEYIGIATNNVAEYTAFVKGLKIARRFKLKRIMIFLDSELLVKQIKGVYRVRNTNLKPFWEEAQSILKQFDSYMITHIRRELNKEADLLAKRSIENFVTD